MYHRLASEGPVQVKCKTVLFVQLEDLHFHVYYGVVGNLAVRLLVRSSFIAGFVTEMRQMEHCIILIWLLSVETVSVFTSAPGTLALLQADLDVEKYTEKVETITQDTSVLSRKVRGDSGNSRNVCISNDRPQRTYVQGDASELIT